MIVAPCFDAMQCTCPQLFAFTIPYGQRTHKTPSTYAYTSFVRDLVLVKLEAVSKHLGCEIKSGSDLGTKLCMSVACGHMPKFKLNERIQRYTMNPSLNSTISSEVIQQSQWLDSGKLHMNTSFCLHIKSHTHRIQLLSLSWISLP